MQENRKKKYCLMLFRYDRTKNKYVNIKNLRYGDGKEALNAYANTPCPASQLIQADTEEELLEKIADMRDNFEDKDWVDRNIYPFT